MKRGSKMPKNEKMKLRKLKKEWDQFLSTNEDTEDEEKDTKHVRVKIMNVIKEKKRKTVDISKGAIPKNRIKISACLETSGATEDNCSSCDETTISSPNLTVESSSEEEAKKSKTTKSRKKNKQREERMGLEELVKAMAKLDVRRVPSQEAYDESSGQDLIKYLEKFETYCRSNFKGNKNMWIGELERYLTGKTLEAFRAVRGVEDTYSTLRRK